MFTTYAARGAWLARCPRGGMRTWLIALALSVAACSGSGSEGDLFRDEDGGGSRDGGGGRDGGKDVGDGGSVDDRGTVSFPIADALLTRGGWCGAIPPFSANDVFELVLWGAPKSAPSPQPMIRVSVWARVSLDTAYALTPAPWKPGPTPKPGDNDIDPETASATDARGNPLLSFSLSRGTRPDVPDANAFDRATMTVLGIPTKEGESLKIRLQLHFTDGQTLDETVTSPPLVEEVTACGGPSR